MAAPSAGNQQPWEFCVVRDAAVRAELATTTAWTSQCGRAPVVIVFCMRTDVRFPGEVPQDMAACVENAWLRTVELGLGGVWMSVAPHDDRMAHVRAALPLPEGTEPFALFSLGHPEGEPQAKGPSRFDESHIHWV